MLQRNLGLSLVAVLLTACLYYRGGFVLLPIAALPILAHELSHILALRLLGQRITGFSLDGSGICIRYDGSCTPAGHILAALAGPFGGAVYALTGLMGVDWLRQSAGLSMLLTAFNLLPLKPLDGGQVFYQLCVLTLGDIRGEELCRAVSAVLLALLLTGGVLLAVWKKSTAPLAAAIWLLLFRNEEQTLVNRGKIL
ncbi:MAG: M50 family metallopeptidase [Oscillospiraceae bacterium]|nr:M50 family metallopeptidase [Oscillospiraceae bacterium]MBR7073955.1 M50 family metallopeptidase [Oscillospiraceae bacterium]